MKPTEVTAQALGKAERRSDALQSALEDTITTVQSLVDGICTERVTFTGLAATLEALLSRLRGVLAAEVGDD